MRNKKANNAHRSKNQIRSMKTIGPSSSIIVPNTENKKSSNTESFHNTRRSMDTSSKIDTKQKLESARNEAERIQEERRRYFNQRMAEFDERRRKRKEKEKLAAEERKEESREWSESLKLNLNKKKRKDEYYRKSIEQKYQNKQKRIEEYERNQKLIEKERFYAKISNDMKDYRVHEAIHDMAVTKNWSTNVIDNIVETYKPEI